MITTSRTMPESDFTPEDSTEDPISERNRENRDRPAAHPETQPNLADALLNSSELQTVLDMLAVMEAAEELDQLQALTEAQKRQVWEATSESLKQKLWQLRNQPHRDRSTANSNTDSNTDLNAELHLGRSSEILEGETQDNLQDEYLEDYYEPETDREADLEDETDEIEDLGQNLALTADSYPTAAPGLTGTSGVIQSSLTASTPQAGAFPADRSTPVLIPEVGDRVILTAQPRLTTAELKAVWQLQRINGDNGEVYDAKLGVRIYPLSWIVVYAKAEPADLAEAPPNSPESEEDF